MKHHEEGYDSSRPPFWTRDQGFKETVVDVDFFVESIGDFDILAMVGFVNRLYHLRYVHSRDMA